MRLITLNGVKLFVYRNGMILRKFNNGWKLLTGAIDSNGYIQHKFMYRLFFKHRIMGYAFLGLDVNNPKQQIDHIDRNPLNNCLNNLRIVSNQQNQFNKQGKGYYHINNRWRAIIKFNNKNIHLGYFDNKEEAQQAYLQAKEKYHIIPVILN